MDNILCMTGNVTEMSALLEGKRQNGTAYQYLTLMVASDESHPQRVALKLLGAMAVAFDSCQIQPTTRLRVYLRIHAFGYTNEAGEALTGNDVSCWKVEILDRDGNVAFCCRK